MSDKRAQTNARDGWITFVLSLAVWGGLLAVFLGLGYLLVGTSSH